MTIGLKQPVLGIAAAILAMAVSLAFISLFAFPTFGSWVSFLMICIIPMQICIGVTWGTNQPPFAANQKQPLKGVLLALVTLIAGAIVAPTHLVLTGGIAQPGPVASHLIIVSVIVTFWAAIMFGGWPFKALIKNEVAAGVAMVVSCYAINFILFQLLFDYSFMQLEPHGMFNAINALVLYVTFIAAMFLVLAFDLWPMTKAPGIMKQPILGIVWSLICFALAGLAFWAGTGAMQMDPMVFLVRVPIPYIFGTIIVLNIFQNSLAGKLTQPVKGIANAALVVIIGTGLAQMYRALAPVLTGTLPSGPPMYEMEIWLASALLSVTFPFLIFLAEFFKFWPLSKSE